MLNAKRIETMPGSLTCEEALQPCWLEMQQCGGFADKLACNLLHSNAWRLEEMQGQHVEAS
jgi:hypothetical protein